MEATHTVSSLRGAKASISVMHGKQKHTLEGIVTSVSPEVDPVNGQIRICTEIDNPDLLLLPGMNATMTISSVQVRRAAVSRLAVPEGGVTRSGR